ncbi:MAG: lytic murein transglycosylase B [Sulfuricaulis sp.]
MRFCLMLLWLVGTVLMIVPSAYALNLDKYPALRGLAAEMVNQQGFSAAQLRHTFGCVKLRPEIIRTIERPKELVPWYEYSQGFLTQTNVRRGVHFWIKHAAALDRAQKQYGVAPEIVVALIGVETQFGRNQGRYPVLDSLTTLMLDYAPRSAYFRQELTEFLLLARELNTNPCHIKGSYAGAMGLPQFMPSSYRQYALDFNGDGKRDIMANPADAIGSVANYLKQHGWEPGEPVAGGVNLEGSQYSQIEKLGSRPVLSERQLTHYGIFPHRLEHPERRAALISVAGRYGRLFRLGYNNFYVITRYNHNNQYAMAVYELGEMLRQRMEDKPSS